MKKYRHPLCLVGVTSCHAACQAVAGAWYPVQVVVLATAVLAVLSVAKLNAMHLGTSHLFRAVTVSLQCAPTQATGCRLRSDLPRSIPPPAAQVENQGTMLKETSSLGCR